MKKPIRDSEDLSGVHICSGAGQPLARHSVPEAPKKLSGEFALFSRSLLRPRVQVQVEFLPFSIHLAPDTILTEGYQAVRLLAYCSATPLSRPLWSTNALTLELASRHLSRAKTLKIIKTCSPPTQSPTSKKKLSS